jgi:predicted XRE-type DNA-binding protein
MAGIDILERLLQGFEALKKSNDVMASAAVDPPKASKPHITKQDIGVDLQSVGPESFEDKIKYQIWCDLVDYIDSTDYSQAELATFLNVQSDVSNLLHCKFSKFSTHKLIRYAGKLNLKVRFELHT